MEHVKIAIIIPIYNSEKTLERCLKSILEQSYRNMQIILINDGSSDRSVNICEVFMNKDKRIEYYFQENKGVSAARNMGLSKVQADVILFIDSDDYIKNGYIENMVRIYQEENVDLVMCSFMYTDNTKCPICENKTKLKKSQIQNRIAIDSISNTFWNSPICKLFSAKLILEKQIYFNSNLCIGEDFLFNLEFFEHANSVVMIPETYYMIQKTENSLSRSFRENEWELQKYIFLHYKQHFISMKQYEKFKLMVDSYLLKSMLYSINAKANSKCEFEELYKYINDIFKDDLVEENFKKRKIVSAGFGKIVVLSYRINSPSLLACTFVLKNKIRKIFPAFYKVLPKKI